MNLSNYLEQLLGNSETIHLDKIDVLHFKANDKCQYQMLVTDSKHTNEDGPNVEYYARLPANCKIEERLLSILDFLVQINKNSKKPLIGPQIININDLNVGNFTAAIVTPYTTSFFNYISEFRNFNIDEKEYVLSGIVLAYENEVNELIKSKNLKSNLSKSLVISRTINLKRKNYIENPKIVEALFGGAENPGCLSVSKKKAKEMGGALVTLKYGLPIGVLMSGDVQPAVVITESPCIIACYSDEVDHVLNLEIEENIAKQYDLKVGTRLVTSNQYSIVRHKDLTYGENYDGKKTSRFPTLSNFFTEDSTQLEFLTSLFSDAMYQKTFDLGIERMNNYDNSTRKGVFWSGISNRKFKKK